MTKPKTFAHIADLQLGCNRFDGRLSRRREQDFYDSWHDLADRLADREDITHVIITGDIFEYASPSTAARYAFEVGLRRIQQRFKNIILVSGNHETPRAAETMHPLRPYQDWTGVITVIDEAVTVDGFRAIPWHWGKPIHTDDLRSDAPVLVVHAACPVLEAYKREGARDYLPEMGETYRYVALGDYHVPTQVATNAWYSGSLEHTSFGEADAETGGWIVTLKPEGGVEMERIVSRHRPMNNIEIPVDHEATLRGVTEAITENPEKMYRLIFKGIEPMQIDPNALAAARDAGKFVKIVFQDRPAPPALVDFGPQTLYDQWIEFCEHAEYGQQVAEVGTDILEEAVANG